MKKIILLILIISSAIYADKMPNLANKSSLAKNLVPAGWKIIDEKQGDLNKDGLDDLVFVIQKTDKKNIQQVDEGLNYSVDMNPKILAIYFKQENGLYTKYKQYNEFIIKYKKQYYDEPFMGISIKKGVLNIDFSFLNSLSAYNYKFRFQKGKFRLIGWDAQFRDKVAESMTYVSINFLSKKMKTTKEYIDPADGQDTIRWKRVSIRSLKSLEQLKKPFEWNFYKNRI